MSKRFYYDEFLEEIYDEEIGDYPSNQSICEILNEKDQRIAELEEQLKNVRTKYFVGYDSCFNPIVREMDLDIILPIYMHDKDFKFYDTKKEALEKLKELGEKK